MTGDDLAEKVAAVLGEHGGGWSEIGPDPEWHLICHGCEAILPWPHDGYVSEDERDAAWNAHVAAALLPLIREREAAAWERALREAERRLVPSLNTCRAPHATAIRAVQSVARANPYAGSEGDDDRA